MLLVIEHATSASKYDRLQSSLLWISQKAICKMDLISHLFKPFFNKDLHTDRLRSAGQ